MTGPQKVGVGLIVVGTIVGVADVGWILVDSNLKLGTGQPAPLTTKSKVVFGVVGGVAVVAVGVGVILATR
jgi:hypothetical protein